MQCGHIWLVLSWGLQWVPQLPQLLPFGQSQLHVFLWGVIPEHNVGLPVNLWLGSQEALLASIAGPLSLPTSRLVRVRIATVPAVGNRVNLLSLEGLRQCLCALEVKISILHRVKVGKNSTVGINWRPIQRRVLDAILKPKILRFSMKGVSLYSWRSACCLCCSTWRFILVKVEVLHIVQWNTRCCVGWRKMCELLWFFRESSVSCYLLCYSCMCTFFGEFLIHNSCREFMILKNNWPNLLGLCHFPLNT
jgi:hypothetical protein